MPGSSKTTIVYPMTGDEMRTVIYTMMEIPTMTGRFIMSGSYGQTVVFVITRNEVRAGMKPMNDRNQSEDKTSYSGKNPPNDGNEMRTGTHTMIEICLLTGSSLRTRI